MNLKFWYLKIDFSCEASVNFHPISQDATPATVFAPCRHLMQPCQCETRNTTRLKCCACHENCNTSSENVAKVLRLPHKTIFDALQNTRLNDTKCHACHAKRSNETFETSKNDHFCRTYHRHGHTVLTRTGCGRLRTVANGCEHKHNVERTHPQPPDPPEWNGNPCYAFGKRKKKRAREQEGKRAREQEGKRECEDVKMWGCEVVRMWRWEDVKMWRCEDVKMRKCDAKMRRWEDVNMRRCEDVRMWGWDDVRIEDVMWRWEDVKM